MSNLTRAGGEPPESSLQESLYNGAGENATRRARIRSSYVTQSEPVVNHHHPHQLDHDQPNEFDFIQDIPLPQDDANMADFTRLLGTADAEADPAQDASSIAEVGTRQARNETSHHNKASSSPTDGTTRFVSVKPVVSCPVAAGKRRPSDLLSQLNSLGELAKLCPEDRALLHLRCGEPLSWKETARLLGVRFGKEYSVAALQMRYTRLCSRERPWTAAEESLLRRAHAYWRAQKWEMISNKMAELAYFEKDIGNIDGSWSPRSCEAKWNAMAKNFSSN